MVRQVGAMLGVEIPVFWERHAKVAFKDYLGAIPREAPLLVWTDPQRLDWSAEEREYLAGEPGGRGRCWASCRAAPTCGPRAAPTAPWR